MSLKAFHVFFITVSCLLSAFLILWGLRNFQTSGDRTDLALGLIGTLMLVLLIPYFRWFRNKMSRISQMALFVILAGACSVLPRTAFACAVCFGDPNSPMTRGLKGGIIFLIAMTGGVLGSILTIAVKWARRAKSATEP